MTDSGERGDPLRHLPRGKREIRDEVDEEIRFHLEMRAAELEHEGLDAAAAREEALRRFGDLAAAQRACVASEQRRERSRLRREWRREIAHDARHGLRQLRHRPGFAGAAILTLAAGIGATTAIFSVADHVLLRPLPYADVERAVTLWEVDRSGRGASREVSPGNFLAWAERTKSFEALGLAEPSGITVTGEGPPLAVPTWNVTEGFLAALGVRPLIGSGFAPAHHLPNGEPAVILSHGFWRRRYGGDPGIVGRRVELEGVPTTIVGVLPAGIEYPSPKDLWTPKAYREDEIEDRSSAYMHAVARLRPGVTAEEAQADLDRVAAALAAEHPETNLQTGVRIVPLEERVLGPVRPALLVLLVAVALLLLIACANVAGLLLALAAERERELGVRASLGAGRGRLARQLLTESGVLAALGGMAGVTVGALGVRALVRLSPPDIPRLDTAALDERALAFACGTTLVTALLFGVAPALRFSRPDLTHALRTEGRAATAGVGRSRFRAGLVMAEIALALVLLIGAGLLARSFAGLLANDTGFTVERRVALEAYLWDRNPTAEQRLETARRISESFGAVPGVVGVGVTSSLPFHPSRNDDKDPFRIQGRATPPGREPQAFMSVASAGYFGVMDVPVVRGREFTPLDRDGAPAVAVVNETLARTVFAGEDPIGKRVTLSLTDDAVEHEIVGIVGDVRPATLDSEPRPELYVPLAQNGTGSLIFVVGTSVEPERLIPSLRRALWQVDPEQPIYHTATIEQLVADTLRQRRFQLILLSAFSGVALVLAAVGVYGLMSFTTARRVREMGVRLALGAHPREVVGLVVREGLRMGVPGVLLGVAGALVLTRSLEGMLYRVTPSDPVTFLQVAAVMLAVSVLGAWIPARRIVARDPVVALRQE